MIGKCGYNYMKESLLIMHTRSKIQTSQNLIFRYLGISTTYTPQIVLFLGARCAPTIRQLACIVSRCAALKQPHHTPTNLLHLPPSHHHHMLSYDDCNAAIIVYYLRCCAACHMPHHATCYDIGKCHIMAKGVGAAPDDATWGEA